MRRVSPRAVALGAGCLLLAACASGGGGVEGPAAPTPAPAPGPGEPAPPPPPPGGRGPTVVYRPVQSTPYLIERHDTLLLQYPGGASQEQFRDRTAFVHLTVAEGPVADSYETTIVLDSLLAWENGVEVPPDSTAAVHGTRWTATLTASGELRGLTASPSSPLADELSSTLRLLFPRLPAAGVREGMEWTDTTRYELVADAFPGNETVITTYRAAEGAGSDGPRSITLESTGAYTRSGTRMQAEQELQMTATGTREGVHRLAVEEGALVSAQGRDAGEMTISVPAVGQTVPVKQSGTYSIRAAQGESR